MERDVIKWKEKEKNMNVTAHFMLFVCLLSVTKIIPISSNIRAALLCGSESEIKGVCVCDGNPSGLF